MTHPADVPGRHERRDVVPGAILKCHDGLYRRILRVSSALSGPSFWVIWNDGDEGGQVFTR